MVGIGCKLPWGEGILGVYQEDLQNAVNALVLLDQLVCCLDPNTCQAGEVVAARQNADGQDHGRCEVQEADVRVAGQVFQTDFHPTAKLVHFEEDFGGLVCNQIRILGNHCLHVPSACQVGQLGISLVRSHDELHTLEPQHLDQGTSHLRGNIDCLLEVLICLGPLSAPEELHCLMRILLSIALASYFGVLFHGQIASIKNHDWVYLEVAQQIHPVHHKGDVFVSGNTLR
mmetsp:Transcript_11279/g.20316  ORF Transcript_11279/g.20316 Transcript_11279/m.20316 type:complete len:230 (+) Transcript_11279:318-1007(+)